MRVLLAAEQLRRPVAGGVGRYTRGLIQGLDSMGRAAPEVSLLASRPRGPDPLAVLGHPVLASSLPGPALTRGWDSGLVAAPEGFDVVHSVSLAAPPTSDAAAVTVVHDLCWRELPSAFPVRGRRWHEAALRRALHRADLLVVPSRGTASSLMAAGAQASRVEVVEEGADHLPAPDPEAARSRLHGLGVAGPYLLSVGTLEPRKNLMRLFAAYTSARRHLPEPWPLVVVGPHGWGEALEPVPGVVFAGAVDDTVLAALYAGARLLAYVPLAEGFGLPPVEAMLAGAPVVSSPMPSTGGASLEVDPLDVGGISAALARVAGDESVRAELSAAGRRRAASLRWETTATRHAELWERAAGGHRRKAGAPRPTSLRGRRAGGAWHPVGPKRAGSDRVRLSLDVTAVPPHPAGAGRYTIDLAGALARHTDIDLVLLARADDGARWERVAPGARIEAVAPSARPLRLAWEQTRLPGLLGRLGVDVHHGPHYTMPEAAKVPRVVTIHDLTFFDHPEWHERSKVTLFRRAIRVAAGRADALVCVSESTAARLVELSPTRGAVHVARHGVDHERFCPKEAGAGSDAAVLRRLGVVPPYVAFVGTLEPRKDVPTLVRAFDRMSGAHSGLSLVLAGLAGWGADAVDEAVEVARRPERVRRLGYVADEAVPALLRQASAVAYPSLEEGFGLPALEALACAAPLVTTTGSAMEEVTGGAALLVPPGDVPGLAGALDMLVRGDQSEDERRVRGLAVAARHTWEASAEAHLVAYRSVAAPPGMAQARR